MTTEDEKLPYPAEWYPGCPCYACDSKTWQPWPGWPGTFRQRMSLCPTCGNKRCPRAADHSNGCSGSNEPGQPGSLYPAVTPEQAAKGREWLALQIARVETERSDGGVSGAAT